MTFLPKKWVLLPQLSNMLTTTIRRLQTMKTNYIFFKYVSKFRENIIFSKDNKVNPDIKQQLKNLFLLVPIAQKHQPKPIGLMTIFYFCYALLFFFLSNAFMWGGIVHRWPFGFSKVPKTSCRKFQNLSPLAPSWLKRGKEYLQF